MAKKKTEIADKVARYLKAKQAGKRGYERADRLLKEIAAAVEPGQEITLSETGRKAVLIDRFSEKSIVWTPCGARRWELEIIEP
jgi:hypothetical protein